MREIKFRAWSKSHKRMYESFLVYKICQSQDVEFPEDTREDWQPGSVLVGHCFEIDEGIIPICLPPKDVILMQYTGLKDKNGEEIYEGDIVEAWVDFGPAGEQRMTHAVNINAWGCGLQEWTYEELDRLPEVIGNIYENPELIPAQEK